MKGVQRFDSLGSHNLPIPQIREAPLPLAWVSVACPASIVVFLNPQLSVTTLNEKKYPTVYLLYRILYLCKF